jgi:protein-tyrosine phosphatase
MIANVLVVCIGNICRSPIGEVLFRHLADQELSQKITVDSAGIHALVNHPADKSSKIIMEEKGITLEHHKAKQIDEKLIRWADLILVMEKGHTTVLTEKFPQARGKTFRICEWDNKEIDDPYKKSMEHFTASYDLIEMGVKSWMKKLASM